MIKTMVVRIEVSDCEIRVYNYVLCVSIGEIATYLHIKAPTMTEDIEIKGYKSITIEDPKN